MVGIREGHKGNLACGLRARVGVRFRVRVRVRARG